MRGHYGVQDYEGLLCAADVAGGWDWVDPERIGVMGGSYGGYLTNWAITHTDRFVAACTQRSISNWVSFIGTSDIGPEFGGDELGVMPWEDEELLMAKSPIRYVKNVRTPTLILHQDGDQRCPVEQAEQLFTSLKLLGREVVMARYPEESHELSRMGRPDRRLDRLERMVAWLDRWLT